MTVARPRDRHEAEDELASWTGPAPRHGDLARFTGDSLMAYRPTFVFDGATSSFLNAGMARAEMWTEFWEHEHGSLAVAPGADQMVRECDHVDVRRLVLVACRMARTVPVYTLERGARRGWPDPEAVERTLRAAEAWARSGAPATAVILAGRAAEGPPGLARVFPGDHHPAAQCAVAVVRMVRRMGDRFAAPANAAAEVARFAKAYGDESADLEGVVRTYIPLSTLLCARLGLPDPLAIPGVVKANRRPTSRRAPARARPRR